jgi:hypothetical protein
MVGMRCIALAAIVAYFMQPLSSGEKLASRPLASLATSLFAQSAGQTLIREFGPCATRPEANPERCGKREDLSFLLLDAHTGALVASQWPDAEKPIPLGSLIKPFIALAYGQHHGYEYPTHTCYGTSTGCWLPRGHGREGLELAIAQSCNSYFRMLTANLTAEDVLPLATSYGLEPPPADASANDLRGMGNVWLISPLHMASAYLELIRRADEPGVRKVLVGMAESARQGTGAELDHALKHTCTLAKTGTARCTHLPTAAGDGFVIAMMPADGPQILLMVRLHQAPGAEAAKIAGQMLRRIEQ